MKRLCFMLACLVVSPAVGDADGGADLVVSTWRGEGAARNLDLALVRGDGGGPLRFLTRVGVDDHSPTWSPDGEQIVFARRGARRGGIYVLRGSTTSRLSSGARDTAPVFSPDGTQIAFSRAAGVSLMRSDGRGERRLVRTRYVPRQLSWTPDGSRLVYADYEGIRTVDVATGAVTRLPVDGHRPTLSPDGSRIAYMGAGIGRHYRDSNWGIYVAGADGASPTRVVDGQFGPVSWRPDGTGLLVTDGRELAFVDLAARTLTPLAAGSGGAFRPAGPG